MFYFVAYSGKCVLGQTIFFQVTDYWCSVQTAQKRKKSKNDSRATLCLQSELLKRALANLCSDVILIVFFKFACDQIIESMEYFQFCDFQITLIFPCFTRNVWPKMCNVSSVCSIVVTF